VRNLVIVGGLVRDNYEINEPSGVVRAFDVRTGALVWAWDVGNPGRSGAPPAGETYTRATPNVWSTPSFDDALGLVYLPTGNATPDLWGAHRSEADERYSSSIVALDVATGRVRWSFQTVHHDLWDYDVPAQPTLYDVPDGHGGTVPALIQTTKRGQIFMLDRRTGTPIAEVEEGAVTQQGVVADDHLSPTQPYSVGMPALGAERLTESRMWGATLLDRLVCRIEFRKARYDGDFTPPGTTPAIQYPSWLGGVNRGSVSIAKNLGYMIVNDTRVPVTNQLIPRAEYDAAKHADGTEGSGAPQYGTPWGVKQAQFLSPLGVPCQEPPYGAISAIDLATHRIVWSMPLGTLQDSGPWASPCTCRSRSACLPSVVRSRRLRAWCSWRELRTTVSVRLTCGHELWKGRLPLGAETTPITYVSPRSGRQFVAISAGGNLAQKRRGDYIFAFALPK
jgi:quinate dehydrogenase (quinone)